MLKSIKKLEVGLRGREYVAPKTESARVVNQGVLCASGGPVSTPPSGDITPFAIDPTGL